MVYAIHSFMKAVFDRFGLNWWFWYGYFKMTVILSLILHMMLFKNELTKDFPSIPYEQEFP